MSDISRVPHSLGTGDGTDLDLDGEPSVEQPTLLILTKGEWGDPDRSILAVLGVQPLEAHTTSAFIQVLTRALKVIPQVQGFESSIEQRIPRRGKEYVALETPHELLCTFVRRTDSIRIDSRTRIGYDLDEMVTLIDSAVRVATLQAPDVVAVDSFRTSGVRLFSSFRGLDHRITLDPDPDTPVPEECALWGFHDLSYNPQIPFEVKLYAKSVLLQITESNEGRAATSVDKRELVEGEFSSYEIVATLLEQVDQVVEPLGRLVLLNQLARDVMPAIYERMMSTAAEHRGAGGTWRQIGDALGVTPQAAQNRLDPVAREREVQRSRRRRAE